MTHFNRFLLSLNLLLCGLSVKPEQAFSQKNQLDRINLTWAMYRQWKNADRPYIAYTAHQTTHKYRATQNGNHLSLIFTVGVALNGKASTVDPDRLSDLSAQDKASLLNHEQGHSDLAVIYGRILFNDLFKGIYTIKDYQQQVKKIYDRTMKQLAAINARYDIETAHGEEKELQEKWDLYFKKELSKSR